MEITEALDALISFEIEDAGEHTLRFKYRSSAFKYGIIITVASLAGFILIIIFEDKLKKLKLIKLFFVVEKPVDETATTSKK